MHTISVSRKLEFYKYVLHLIRNLILFFQRAIQFKYKIVPTTLMDGIVKQSAKVCIIMRPLNPFMPTGLFNICCPRDCVSRTANEKLVTIVANRH